MAHIIVQDDISEWRKRVRAELNRLAQMQIRVGVLGSEEGELLRIAYVHEFGATISPRNARNLAIPLSPAARKKSPRDYDDAFRRDNSRGTAFSTIVRGSKSCGRLKQTASESVLTISPSLALR